MIRFEIWTDTGRIIVFPAATPFEERIDVAAVQVVCTEARDTIDSATHSDISDEAYGVIESKVTARLVAAVHRIAKAKLRFEYGVFYYGDAVADTT